jgi:hypothetical protein
MQKLCNWPSLPPDLNEEESAKLSPLLKPCQRRADPFYPSEQRLCPACFQHRHARPPVGDSRTRFRHRPPYRELTPSPVLKGYRHSTSLTTRVQVDLTMDFPGMAGERGLEQGRRPRRCLDRPELRCDGGYLGWTTAPLGVGLRVAICAEAMYGQPGMIDLSMTTPATSSRCCWRPPGRMRCARLIELDGPSKGGGSAPASLKQRCKATLATNASHRHPRADPSRLLDALLRSLQCALSARLDHALTMRPPQ